MSSEQHKATESVRQYKPDNNSQLSVTTDEVLLQQYRFYKIFADIGEWLLAIISGEAIKTLALRITNLINGAWLPGMGDVKTIAALTNKSDRTIEDFVADHPRTKHHVGRQVYYRLTDIATSGQIPADHAPAKRSGK